MCFWLGLVRDVMLHLLGKGISPMAFQLIVMAFALPATILSAMLSYRYLERPFLRWKKSFTIVGSRPAEQTNPSAMIWRPRPRLKAS